MGGDHLVTDTMAVEDVGLLDTVFNADFAAFLGQLPKLASRYRAD